MAMFLVPSANEENAGTYAGWIAASFMIGRSLTAYAWGICSDRYGRVRTLQLSLGLSGLATLLFGLSSNFVVALVWRFCLGLSNGLISTAKVVVSELADGDTDRECQTMNLVMSMWGGAFLIAPAMSGALAEPLKQYRAAWLQNTPILSNLLKRWPFLLPNLLGSIICVVGLICVHLFIMETLPKQKLRPIRSLVGDIWNAVWAWVPTNNDQESSALLPTKDSPSLYGGNNVLQDDDCSCEPDLSTSHGLTQRIEQDVQDAIRSSQLMSNNLNSALTTRRARQSIVTDIERRCQCAAGGRTGNICCKGMIGAEAFKRIRRASMRQTLPPATMSSLWANTRTRELMLVHWLGSFLMVALDEAFPLFCISIHAGGLGLLENSIAHVLSASGILFLVVQLVFYAPLIEKLGLFGSMSLATAIMPVLTVTLSVAGWLNQTASASSGQLSWTAFIFLTIDMAVARAADSTFFTGISKCHAQYAVRSIWDCMAASC